MHWLRTLILSALLAALLSATAIAHAVLVASEPADGERLDAAPARIRLAFNEPVRLLSVRLIGTDGRQLLPAGAVRAADDTVEAALPALPPGSYVLSYRIASADGHTVGGSVAFYVGQAQEAAPVTATGTEETAWRVASAIGRFAIYGSMLIAAGGALFGALVLGELGKRESGHGRYLRRACLVAAAALVLGIGVEGGLAVLAPAEALLDPDLWQLGAAGPAGTSAGVSLVGLALIALGTSTPPAVQPAFAIVGAVVAAMGLAFTGHAATAPPRGLASVAVAIHVLAAAYWVGALIPLRRALDREALWDAAAITLRFSRLAVAIVTILVAAGLVLAVLQLGGINPLWETAYGRLLVAKLALVGALLGLAAGNKWRLTPALALGSKPTAHALRRSIAFELAAAVAILAVTAALGTVPPPRAQAPAAPTMGHTGHAGRAAHDGHETGPSIVMFVPAPPYEARIDLGPAQLGATTITARLFHADGKPLDALEASLSLALPEAGIEPLTRRMHRQAAGVFVHSGPELSVPGTWRLRVEALVTDFEKAVFEKAMAFP